MATLRMLLEIGIKKSGEEMLSLSAIIKFHFKMKYNLETNHIKQMKTI